jgi:hypothetical protein
MMFEAACSKLGCPEADTCRPNTAVFSESWTDAAKPLPDGLADHDAGVRIGHSFTYTSGLNWADRLALTSVRDGR